jgi:hypothetical protein
LDRLFGFRVDLVEVFPQPRQESPDLLRYACHREVVIRLAGIGGSFSVALSAESIDRGTGLVGGHLRSLRANRIGAVQQVYTLCVLRLR